MIEGIMSGMINILQPFHLLIMFLAVVIGFFGGAMPGVGGVMLIVILLPITYGMDPIPAFLLLTTIYAAVSYSGSISAILFRIPGTPEAVATTFDGYPMSQKGKTGEALGLAITSSAIGGIVGALFLIFLTPILASIALKFSSPEYFILSFLALIIVASVSKGDITKGLLAVLFGLFLATIGVDSGTAIARFTFDSTNLVSGLQLVPVITGLFAISEVLKNIQLNQFKQSIQKKKSATKLFIGKLLKRCAYVIGRSSIVGVFIGILPGVGGTAASLISYSMAQRTSKNPEKFGTGMPEGVAAPETANNAASTAALIPLISLGIPGSATTAVILGAFILHGLQPGPMMVVEEPELVYTLFIGLLIVNIIVVILAKPFISLFSLIVKVPYSALGPIIIVFSFIGTYAVRNSMFDVGVMLFFGVIGYLFDKFKFPLAPIVMGFVLGPLAEVHLRRSLMMSGGDYTFLFTRPISATLLGLAFIIFFSLLIKKLFQAKTQ